MAVGDTAALGALLRRQRRAAGLSQEALAEHAGLSVDAIAALERGRRTAPRPSTVTMLATALGLNAAERAGLLLTALGTSAAADTTASPVPSPAYALTAALPAPPSVLIGREQDLERACHLLQQSAPPPRLLTLIGPGGVGKTRLALAIGGARGELRGRRCLRRSVRAA